MGIEIERKFLVSSDAWRDRVKGTARYRQGYLANNERCSVRIRLADTEARINIKSFELEAQRKEYEYPIPIDEARELLDHLCAKPLIEKTRHFVEHRGHQWEIDVFEGDNEGLVMAEIELEHIDESYEKPDWAGAEVTKDPRYYNVNLIKQPYKNWR